MRAIQTLAVRKFTVHMATHVSILPLLMYRVQKKFTTHIKWPWRVFGYTNVKCVPNKNLQSENLQYTWQFMRAVCPYGCKECRRHIYNTYQNGSLKRIHATDKIGKQKWSNVGLGIESNFKKLGTEEFSLKLTAEEGDPSPILVQSITSSNLKDILDKYTTNINNDQYLEAHNNYLPTDD